MALLDFIELSDDEEIVFTKKNDEEIVDLSSDDETAEESHNDLTCGSPGQHPTTLYDGQTVFVAEGEGEATESGNAEGQHPTTLYDGQAVFVAEGEGEATESGNVEEVTPSSAVTEKGSLGTAASQNCPDTPTAVSFPHPTSISAKALTFEDCDANLLRVNVKRHRKLFHTDTPWRSLRLEDKNKGHSKSMEEMAVDLKRSRNLEEQNTSAASQNSSHTPAAVTFPNSTSISAKARTSEACNADLLRVEVKRPRKFVHTDRHWRSPRIALKIKDRSKSMVERAVDLKRSRNLEEQNTSVRSKKKNKLSFCAKCRMCKEHLY